MDKYTFLTLIDKYTIRIPRIQRDYAQGRTDTATNRIRTNFLKKIHETLLDKNKKMDLDFIYGIIKTVDEKKYFIPLDGQQRLTTLFLLHWYAASKANIPGKAELLCKFSYETRQSAIDFCHKLSTNTIIFENKPSDEIKNSTWYFSEWVNDPTIRGMLKTLDSINDIFSGMADMWHRLEADDVITFSFYDLKDYKRIDDLYIKMNARGKLLTEFEHFKAFFERYLQQATFLSGLKVDLSQVYDTSGLKELEGLTYHTYFAIKMDTQWTDLFWKMRDELGEIDHLISNFISYISEMLYYTHKEVTATNEAQRFSQDDFGCYEDAYIDKTSVDMLFATLNMFAALSQQQQKQLFEAYFYAAETDRLKTYAAETDRLNTFSKSNLNFFEQSYTSPKEADMGIVHKVLFWVMLKYYKLHGFSDKKSNELLAILRLYRNWLSGKRQYMVRTPLTYNSDLRYTDYHSMLSKLDKVLLGDIWGNIDFNNLEQEKQKFELLNKSPYLKPYIYGLENSWMFQGNLRNINIDENVEYIHHALNEEGLLEDTSLFIRALLCVGYNVGYNNDHALLVGHSWFGPHAPYCDRYYFGSESCWNVLFTWDRQEKCRISQILPAFFIELQNQHESVEDAMKKIIDKWCQENPLNKLHDQGHDDRWYYYFINYKAITENDTNNVFLFINNNTGLYLMKNITLQGKSSNINYLLYSLGKDLNIEAHWGDVNSEAYLDYNGHKVEYSLTGLVVDGTITNIDENDDWVECSKVILLPLNAS